MMEPKGWIVVSVGGSLIVPDQIDTDFLSRFNALIRKHSAESGQRFVIITGGGKTARRYQEAAGKVSTLNNIDLDWLGIHSTRLNAHLMRAIFADIAHPVIIETPMKIESDAAGALEPILIAAGWKPGWSTDYVAVKIAEGIGAKKLANLSNIDYVYDSDPRKNAGAKALERLEWPAFRALLPSHWDPGLSCPFDPIAAREAEEHSMEVAIINGNHLEEFEKYISGVAFRGTVIA